MSQQLTAFPRPAAGYHTIPRRTSSDCTCLMNKVSSDKSDIKVNEKKNMTICRLTLSDYPLTYSI